MSIENVRIRIGHLSLAAATLISIFFFAPLLRAQDDVTTQNASSALGGGWITGPASNPLSFLNGPVNRTYGSTLPFWNRSNTDGSMQERSSRN